MSITVASIGLAVARAQGAMPALEQELNAADAKLGDGDTGGMLARLVGRMAEQDLSAVPDLGTAFSILARAAAAATGSSLGTLFATALLTLGRETKGRQSVPEAELSGLVAKARDAMMARGGAKLGDKTVLDSLDAIALVLDGLNDAAQMAVAAREAAEHALEDFRGRPNKIGRARMFGDATIGMDDPGMLALAKLARAVTTD